MDRACSFKNEKSKSCARGSVPQLLEQDASHLMRSPLDKPKFQHRLTPPGVMFFHRGDQYDLLEKLFRMVARVEDAVVLAQKFVARVFADGAELVIDVGDGTLHVGGGDDRVLVESVFLLPQFLLGIAARPIGERTLGRFGSCAPAKRRWGQRRDGDPCLDETSCRSTLHRPDDS